MANSDALKFYALGDEVLISHGGADETVLRGQRALHFLEDVEHSDPQELMARLTGGNRPGTEPPGHHGSSSSR